jgi:hemoglobin/transferrin/lactoferrin receptor protein
MSFQTLIPRFSTVEKKMVSGNGSLRYSSANNEKTGHFDANFGWKKWAAITSISSNDFGDLKMGNQGPKEYLRPFYVEQQNGVDVVVTNENPLVQKPTAYSQINLMQKVRFAPNENWDVQYGLHFSETSNYARYDRHIRYNTAGLPRYGEFYYGPQKWIMNNLTVTHKSDSKFYNEASIRMAHQFFEESRISRNINNPNREIRVELVNAYSINVDFTKATTTKNKLFYGLEYVLNDVNSTGINENIAAQTSAVGPSRYPQAMWESYAVYLNNQYKFSEKAVDFIIKIKIKYKFPFS